MKKLFIIITPDANNLNLYISVQLFHKLNFYIPLRLREFIISKHPGCKK